MPSKPPVAAKHNTSVERHGHTQQDDYAWLKAPNWQQVMRDPSVLDAEIRSYLEAENAYTAELLTPVENFRLQLLEEMKGRIKQDDSTVSSQDGAYFYYRRFETGGQHPIFCRRHGDGSAPEEMLLDAERMAAGETFFRIAGCEHSPDHHYLAYAVDLNGSEYYSVNVKDLETGTLLDDRITDTQGGAVWGNDGKTLYYARLDENHRPSRVFRHLLGDAAENDELLYEETDPSFFVTIGRTESRCFIVIKSSDHGLTAEIRTIDANRPNSAPDLFAAREAGVDYDVSDHGDRFFILTNADDAIDYKIMETPLANRERVHWCDAVSHEPGRLIRRMEVTDKFLVWLERSEGLPRLVVTQFANGERHEVAFDEEAYDLGLIPGFEYDTTNLRFAYSSLTTPQQIYDYDMDRRTRVLRKEQEIPSGHDPSAYVSQRLYATSRDGVQVPISLFHARSTPLDGTAPLLLYGYGSYGHSVPASFSASRLSLVDRGFVYAIAHIRGGTDNGYRWYFDGKLSHKRNTFLDFIAAAAHLIGAGYTKSGHLVAHGGSAGGMLMGAVVNMRPDLFKAALAEVPFVDVLNTMCDAELPLTPPEWTEWGNPILDEEAYDTIRSYCPYSNVSRQDYPHILVTAGLTDPRVTYWEPAKWVAKLRAHKADENLLLLRTNMDAGHAGASGRFDKLEEVALVYAFALMVFGISA
jgi:oligopeptidase B